MLVDGFNDLHGFRASVPDDGEFDGVMGFAVPVLHVSVKERGAALLTLLSQFRQSKVEEVDVGQPPMVRYRFFQDSCSMCSCRFPRPLRQTRRCYAQGLRCW